MNAHAIMRGRSMHPLLREGMLLEVSRSPQKPAVGQIVVFDGGDRLIAHRVIQKRGTELICCGDAQPDRIEIVKPGAVVGTVRAVYARRGEHMRRIDRGLFWVRGYALAYLQPLRSVWKRVAPHLRERTYRALIEAAGAIVRRDSAALIEAVESATPSRFASMAQRHRMGPAFCAALEPLQQNVCARAVFARLRRERWSAAAYMARYRAQVLDVARCLQDAHIEFVLLKGAARAFRQDQDWALHQSEDIDVLVASDHVDRARAALTENGYTYRCGVPEQVRYVRRHHHLAPLFPRAGGVPVEIHHALHYSLKGTTTLEDMRGYVVEIHAGRLSVLSLNRVGSAVHYAIHAIDPLPLRDIFLLAQMLTSLSDAERAAVRCGLKRAGCTQRAPLAALSLASAMADLPCESDAATLRYVYWLRQRYELPRVLRMRAQCADAWFGAEGAPAIAAIRAAWRYGTVPGGVARLAAGTAIAVYLAFMR